MRSKQKNIQKFHVFDEKFYKHSRYEILNIKVGWNCCKNFIIQNVIFWPHWLKPFSTSEETFKKGLKVRQFILMESESCALSPSDLFS